MLQNVSKIFGIPSVKDEVYQKGMPASLVTVAGRNLIVPYTTVANNYTGVILEDYNPFDVDVQRIGENILSVGAVGFTQVIASGAVDFGDLIEPTATGYAKTTDAAKAVGKALSQTVNTGDWLKVMLYKI